MQPHERAAFLRRAIAEGDTLSVAALLTAPNALVGLEPETRAHLEAEWRERAAPAETAALAELQRATEAAGWAATQLRRLVAEHLMPPDPSRPAA
jgi:hypothetical protein